MFLIWNLGLSAVVWLAAQGGGTPYDVQTDLVVQERYGVQDPFGVIEETLLGSSDTHVYHHPWCSLASKTKPGKYAMFLTRSLCLIFWCYLFG